jgi:DNA-binding transcriptional ArsR family regulator
MDNLLGMPTGKSVAPITNIEDPRYVKALAHPLRIRLLALLEERDASPVQLAEHVDATLGTVAYHVRTLERLGLIEMVATHQRRGATEHVYAAREHPRFSDEAWQNTSPIAKHAMIASIISQIGQYVTQSAAAGGFDRGDAHFTRTALKLDQEGWAEMVEATRTWLEQVRDIEQRTQKRIKRTGEQVFDAGLVVLFFEAVPFFDTPPTGNGRRAGKRSSAGGSRHKQTATTG